MIYVMESFNGGFDSNDSNNAWSIMGLLMAVEGRTVITRVGQSSGE